MVDSLRASMAPDVAAADVRLISAACHKRVYIAGTSRLILWDIGDRLRGKGTSVAATLPTEACITRALELASELMPAGDRIIEREIRQDPELWRDPDVGLVSWLECTGDEPDYETIATMLHETNHRVSRGRCIFDFSSDRDLCFDIDPALPPGAIARYAAAPARLDPDGASIFMRLQELYLVQNQQSIRSLLEEVMSYRIEAEMYAVGAKRKLYPPANVTIFNNLPAMMTIATRYLVELSARDPKLAASQFGPHSRNRDAVLAVLDAAEASYQMWLAAVGKPGNYERVLWDEYQRNRKRWLASDP